MRDMDNIAIDTWLKENTTGGYKYQRLKRFENQWNISLKGFGEEIPKNKKCVGNQWWYNHREMSKPQH